mgnify:FL=1
MLAGLSQHQLGHTVLPLGDYTKAEVRQQAEAMGLLEQQVKKDSQDICFVPDGDYMGFLCQWGLEPQPGNFIAPDGTVLGPHRGYEGYTIGQRRGLEIAAGRRVYVLSKPRPDVVIGDGNALFTTDVTVTGTNWILWEQPPERFRASVKLRYTAKPAACTVTVTDSGAQLVFDEPQRAVTPGQAAVFYEEDLVLGSGTIV